MTTSVSLIPPHGGSLIERLAPPSVHDRAYEEAHALPRIVIDARVLSDLRLLGNGALSPLDGFMTGKRYNSVVRDMRLENDLVWSMPITLPIDSVAYAGLAGAERVSLVCDGVIVATLEIHDVFEPAKIDEALKVYGTDDPAHPGVKVLFEQGDLYLGGPVTVFQSAYDHQELAEYQLSPKEVRAAIAERGWRSVVAFQTRNPIHRAHEYLQKCALEMVDGLLIHPLVGQTKADDVDAHTRFACYETLLSVYYPAERVLLSAFPASMRYAGPREALFHAICRKNYGCTHFIVGRDHAGVGNYYGTYDAQKIFDGFGPEEIGIVPLKFEHAFYCDACQGMASAKTCPHSLDHHLFLSGTKVREMLQSGQVPPPEFTRPEVARILIQSAQAGATTAGGAIDGR